MARLALWQTRDRASCAPKGGRFRRQDFGEERWLIVPAGSLVIAPEGLGDGAGGLLKFVSEEVEQQFHQSHQGDAVGPANLLVEPQSKLHEPTASPWCD